MVVQCIRFDSGCCLELLDAVSTLLDEQVEDAKPRLVPDRSLHIKVLGEREQAVLGEESRAFVGAICGPPSLGHGSALTTFTDKCSLSREVQRFWKLYIGTEVY